MNSFVKKLKRGGGWDGGKIQAIRSNVKWDSCHVTQEMRGRI